MADERQVKAVIEIQQKGAEALGQITESLKGVAIAFAAVAAAGAAASALFIKAAQAASEQEQADVRLAAALHAIGQNTEENRKELLAFASQLQASLGIADETIQEVMATLIQFGRLTGQQLERATKATFDYAAATGGDAKSAALALSKAIEGGLARLPGIAIKFEEGASRAERFAKVMGAIENVAGGTAQALGTTFAGSMDKVSVAFSDLEETIGNIIVKSPAVKQLFSELVVLIQNVTEVLVANQTSFIQWASTFIARMAKVADAGVSMIEVFDKLNVLSAAWHSVNAPMLATADILAALTHRSQDLKPLTDALHASLRRIEDAASQTAPAVADVAAKLGKGKGGLSSAALDAAEAAAKAADAAAAIHFQFLQIGNAADISTMQIEALGKAILDDFTEKIKPSLITIDEAMQHIVQNGVAAFNEALLESNLQVESLAQTMQGTLRTFGVNSALAIGDAMVDAANGAHVSWSKVMKDLLRDLEKAIVRAVIIQTLLGLSSHGASQALAGAEGSSAVTGIGVAQHGGDVRGPGLGWDSVLARLQPGEIVLPASRRDDFESMAALGKQVREMQQGSGVGKNVVNAAFAIIPRQDDRGQLKAMMDGINVLVEKYGYRLAASHLVP